jgi:hypothetical protein
MIQFNLEHKTRDLVHQEKAFFNKNNFGEDTILEMLPT